MHGDPHAGCLQRGGGRTYESLEQVALEDVDDPLDGVSELPVLGVLQLGPVLLQQQQGSLCIWRRRRRRRGGGAGGGGGAQVSQGYRAFTGDVSLDGRRVKLHLDKQTASRSERTAAFQLFNPQS